MTQSNSENDRRSSRSLQHFSTRSLKIVQRSIGKAAANKTEGVTHNETVLYIMAVFAFESKDLAACTVDAPALMVAKSFAHYFRNSCIYAVESSEASRVG